MTTFTCRIQFNAPAPEFSAMEGLLCVRGSGPLSFPLGVDVCTSTFRTAVAWVVAAFPLDG